MSDEKNKGVKGGKRWDKSPVPTDYRIIGLGPIKLTVRYAAPTAGVLSEVLGYQQTRQYMSE